MLGAAAGTGGSDGRQRSHAGFVASALRLPLVRAGERALRRRADEVLDRLGLVGIAAHPAAGPAVRDAQAGRAGPRARRRTRPC